jgi:signal peptidase I
MEPTPQLGDPLGEVPAATAGATVDRPSPTPQADPDSFFNLKAWARDLVVSLFIAGVFIVFLYQPVKVEGTSMMPQLYDQERIFINKFVYKFETIQQGDVVVFWYPLDPTKSYIKRIIGLPGDIVRISGGRVMVNGAVIKEPYVAPEYFDNQSYPPVKVEPDHYFVMGDHRNSSNDSRAWGTVARSYIYGKAVLVYWPMRLFGRVQ